MPAELRTHVRGEHPGGPRGGLQLAAHGVVAQHTAVPLLDGDDRLPHERGGPLREIRDGGIGREIDGHRTLLAATDG